MACKWSIYTNGRSIRMKNHYELSNNGLRRTQVCLHLFVTFGTFPKLFIGKVLEECVDLDLKNGFLTGWKPKKNKSTAKLDAYKPLGNPHRPRGHQLTPPRPPPPPSPSSQTQTITKSATHPPPPPLPPPPSSTVTPIRRAFPPPPGLSPFLPPPPALSPLTPRNVTSIRKPALYHFPPDFHPPHPPPPPHLSSFATFRNSTSIPPFHSTHRGIRPHPPGVFPLASSGKFPQLVRPIFPIPHMAPIGHRPSILLKAPVILPKRRRSSLSSYFPQGVPQLLPSRQQKKNKRKKKKKQKKEEKKEEKMSFDEVTTRDRKKFTPKTPAFQRLCDDVGKCLLCIFRQVFAPLGNLHRRRPGYGARVFEEYGMERLPNKQSE